MAYLYTFLVFLTWFCIDYVAAQANNSTFRILRDPESFVSNNGIFRIGFFSPSESVNRYLGVWYDRESDVMEVVWVANRENPLTDSSGVLRISEDETFEVVNGQNKSFWSPNVTEFKLSNYSVAQLLDTGNLVLLSNPGGTIIWQSFDHPTDSFLPQMTFTIDKSLTGRQVLFRSWKTPSDPSGGNFTVGIGTRIPPEVFLWDGDRPYWRNGPWNGNLFIGARSVLSVLNDNDKIYFGYSEGNQASLLHFVVNYDGALVQKGWDAGSKKWEIVWRSRQSDCDVYGKCGPFASCNPANSPICGCLKGFIPKNNDEWEKGNLTNGCIQNTSLDCSATGARADGFWKIRNVKVPDNATWLSANAEDDCRSLCVGECSCLAYAYYSSIGCMTWNSSLLDIEQLSDSKGIDLSVRLANSELGETNLEVHHSRWKITVIVVVIVGTTILGICLCLLRLRWLRKHYVVVAGKRVLPKETRPHNYMNNGSLDDIEFGDLPLFGLEKMVNATNNFHNSNKLGRGGFGTVYKGEFEDGEKVAIKRLSKASGQGFQEFMNEVLLISKLQHKNLVRLLGCCAEGEEKMLVYEYLPNKSLDALLFDQQCQCHLDWKTRFSIIEGICRGLLYLHRDSRLRIIHRDLKASNILLDENFIPKISDFGMARIFGGNEDQAETKRVVGTYGYMSPEYAMEGRFSEKLDVFSFGVLLLEIISGRRNGSFKDEESLSLLQHAWKLWSEDEIASIIDPSISQLSSQAELLRCIQVALLCVQELPEDRPSISMVISMFDTEISNLPYPKQPGFTRGRNVSHENNHEYFSINHVSLTYFSGR